MAAWTFDELYGRDTALLKELVELKQSYVCEIPSKTHGWLKCPKVLKTPKVVRRRGRRRSRYPRVRKADVSCRIDNLIKYSPVFGDQNWQRYRIKDTDRGPEVWEVKWAWFWRNTTNKLPTPRHTLIVARNVRTGEVKYFLSNKVLGQHGVTLRWLLQVAFGRWAIETCFRTAKEELGMDHFEVRGWRCVHRHYYVTQLSHLFSSRLRQAWDDLDSNDPFEKLTVEQVRMAVDTYLKYGDLPPPERFQRFQITVDHTRYHQKRNAQAMKSHTKTRIQLYLQLGIDVDKIKSCKTNNETSIFTE